MTQTTLVTEIENELEQEQEQEQEQEARTQSEDETMVPELEARKVSKSTISVTGIEAGNARFVDQPDGSEAVALPSGVVVDTVIAAGTITHAHVIDSHNGEPIDFIRVYVKTPTTTFSVVSDDAEQVKAIKRLIPDELEPTTKPVRVTSTNIKAMGSLSPQYKNGRHRGCVLSADHVTVISPNELAQHLLRAGVDSINRFDGDGDTELMDDSADDYADRTANSLGGIAKLVS